MSRASGLSARAEALPFFYGWLIVGGAALVSFVEVSFFNPTLGVFIRPLSHDFGWSRAAISLSISLGTLGAALIGPLLGPYLDRRGPRLPLLVGVLLAAGCAFALAGIHRLWQFELLFGVGRTLTVGVLDISLSVTVSKWFIARRGQAVSITVLGQRLGFAVLPLLVQIFVLHGNWRAAFLALGVLLLALATPPIFFVRRQPEDLGLRPDGLPCAADVSVVRQLAGVSSVDLTLRQALRTPAFWLITFAIGQSLLGQGAINLHQLPHMEDRGIPPAAAAGAVSVFAIAGAAGALLSNWPRRRLGARRAFAGYLFLCSLGVLILIDVHHIWQAYAFATFYGLAFGGQLTMQAVVYADVFGRAYLGAIRGLAIPIQLAGNSIGPVLAGWIYDRTGSYVIAFTIFLVLFLLSAVYCLLAPDPRPRSAAP